MKKAIILFFVFILLGGVAAGQVSQDWEVPGYLKVTGVTTLEGEVTATGGIKATGGTIEATTFIGGGSQLTDIQADIIATNAVTASAIAAGAVTSEKITDEAVTSVKIADDAITNADINTGAAIAYSKLNLSSSITGGDLASDVNISTTGNVTAAAVYGDGSNLSGIVSEAKLTAHLTDTVTHGATGAVVGTTNSQTLTNKTLTAPTINTAVITGGTVTNAALSLDSTIETSANSGFEFKVGKAVWAFRYEDAILADTGLYFNYPVGLVEWRYTTDGPIWTLDAVNKHVTQKGNLIYSGTNFNTTLGFTDPTVGSATLTIPDLAGVGDTITLNALAQTLTNKTLTSPTISGGTIDNAAIGGTTPTTGIFTTVTAETSIVVEDPGAGTNTVRLRVPDPLAGSYTLTLPADDGTLNQTLVTDGNGVLSWSSAGSGTVTQIDTGHGLTGGPLTTTGVLSIDALTVVTTTDTQTLTNKTLTSPTINGNATVPTGGTMTIADGGSLRQDTTTPLSYIVGSMEGQTGTTQLLIQSGTGAIAGTATVTVNFPVSFSSAPLVVFTPTTLYSTANNESNYISNATTTGFTLSSQGSDTFDFNWIAIGPR